MMAIYKHEDGTCTISARRQWRPGVYEDEKTARIAQRRDDRELQSLQDQANRDAGGTCGVITAKMLKSAPA